MYVMVLFPDHYNKSSLKAFVPSFSSNLVAVITSPCIRGPDVSIKQVADQQKFCESIKHQDPGMSL